MLLALATLVTVGAPVDTLRLAPGEALARAEQVSFAVRAADARARAARSGVGAARAWPNPTLNAGVENLVPSGR